MSDRRPPLKHTCQRCKLSFMGVPANARFLPPPDALAGWYWECSCGNTLFQPKVVRYPATPPEKEPA